MSTGMRLAAEKRRFRGRRGRVGRVPPRLLAFGAGAGRVFRVAQVQPKFMTPLQKILAAYRATSQSEREKGTDKSFCSSRLGSSFSS